MLNIIKLLYMLLYKIIVYDFIKDNWIFIKRVFMEDFKIWIIVYKYWKIVLEEIYVVVSVRIIFYYIEYIIDYLYISIIKYMYYWYIVFFV